MNDVEDPTGHVTLINSTRTTFYISEHLSQLRQLLRCSVCLDTFDKPVVTDCTHVFCERCVSTHASYFPNDKAPCPICERKMIANALQRDTPYVALTELSHELINRFDKSLGCQEPPTFDELVEKFKQDQKLEKIVIPEDSVRRDCENILRCRQIVGFHKPESSREKSPISKTTPNPQKFRQLNAKMPAQSIKSTDSKSKRIAKTSGNTKSKTNKSAQQQTVVNEKFRQEKVTVWVNDTRNNFKIEPEKELSQLETEIPTFDMPSVSQVCKEKDQTSKIAVPQKNLLLTRGSGLKNQPNIKKEPRLTRSFDMPSTSAFNFSKRTRLINSSFKSTSDSEINIEPIVSEEEETAFKNVAPTKSGRKNSRKRGIKRQPTNEMPDAKKAKIGTTSKWGEFDGIKKFSKKSDPQPKKLKVVISPDNKRSDQKPVVLLDKMDIDKVVGDINNGKSGRSFDYNKIEEFFNCQLKSCDKPDYNLRQSKIDSFKSPPKKDVDVVCQNNSKNVIRGNKSKSKKSALNTKNRYVTRQGSKQNKEDIAMLPSQSKDSASETNCLQSKPTVLLVDIEKSKKYNKIETAIAVIETQPDPKNVKRKPQQISSANKDSENENFDEDILISPSQSRISTPENEAPFQLIVVEADVEKSATCDVKSESKSSDSSKNSGVINNQQEIGNNKIVNDGIFDGIIRCINSTSKDIISQSQQNAKNVPSNQVSQEKNTQNITIRDSEDMDIEEDIFIKPTQRLSLNKIVSDEEFLLKPTQSIVQSYGNKSTHLFQQNENTCDVLNTSSTNKLSLKRKSKGVHDSGIHNKVDCLDVLSNVTQSLNIIPGTHENDSTRPFQVNADNPQPKVKVSKQYCDSLTKLSDILFAFNPAKINADLVTNVNEALNDLNLNQKNTNVPQTNEISLQTNICDIVSESKKVDMSIQTDSVIETSSHGFRISSNFMFDSQHFDSVETQTDALVCSKCNHCVSTNCKNKETLESNTWPLTACFDNIQFDTQDILNGKNISQPKPIQQKIVNDKCATQKSSEDFCNNMLSQSLSKKVDSQLCRRHEGSGSQLLPSDVRRNKYIRENLVVQFYSEDINDENSNNPKRDQLSECKSSSLSNSPVATSKSQLQLREFQNLAKEALSESLRIENTDNIITQHPKELYDNTRTNTNTNNVERVLDNFSDSIFTNEKLNDTVVPVCFNEKEPSRTSDVIKAFHEMDDSFDCIEKIDSLPVVNVEKICVEDNDNQILKQNTEYLPDANKKLNIAISGDCTPPRDVKDDDILSDSDIIESTPEKSQGILDNTILSQLDHQRSIKKFVLPPIIEEPLVRPTNEIIDCLNETFTPPAEFKDFFDEMENLENETESTLTENNKDDIQQPVKDDIDMVSLTPDLLFAHELGCAPLVTSTPFTNKKALAPSVNFSPIHSSQTRKPPNLPPTTPTTHSPMTSTPKQKSILNFVRPTERLKETNYSVQNYRDREFKKPIVACTRMSKEQIMRITSLANKRLISFSNVFTTSVSHMVVSVNENNCLIDDTIKYISAVAARIWVISFKWVEQCLKEGRIVDEEPFEVFDISGMDGPKRARLTGSSNPLLRDYKIYAAPPFRSTTRKEIENVITLLGGEVAHSSDDLVIKNGKICLIVTEISEIQDSDVYDAWLETLKVITVDIEWLSRSVGQYQIKSVRNYALYSDESICDLGYPAELLNSEPYLVP